MFITIAASLTCICAALLPAAAEMRRVMDERENPIRKLAVPTRRTQVQGKAS